MRILEYARKVGVDRVLYTQTWAEMAGYWGKGEIFSPQLPRKLKYTGDHAFYAITKCYDSRYYGVLLNKNMELKILYLDCPNVYLYHPRYLLLCRVQKEIGCNIDI